MLPRHLREDLVNTPGKVLARRTADGVLLTPAGSAGELSVGEEDGLPVLALGRPVSNDEVLAAIEKERSNQ